MHILQHLHAEIAPFCAFLRVFGGHWDELNAAFVQAQLPHNPVLDWAGYVHALANRPLQRLPLSGN